MLFFSLHFEKFFVFHNFIFEFLVDIRFLKHDVLDVDVGIELMVVDDSAHLRLDFIAYFSLTDHLTIFKKIIVVIYSPESVFCCTVILV